MTTKKQEEERQEAIERLREILKPGDTVHTLLAHVSRSGMQRSIRCIIAAPADYDRVPGDRWEPVDISWQVARATGMRFDSDRGGVKVGGVGMDMGFHLVYSLSRALYPKGFGEPCLHCGERPETDAAADAMRQAPCPKGGVREPHEFRGRNGDTSGWDTDGGYALHRRWL